LKKAYKEVFQKKEWVILTINRRYRRISFNIIKKGDV
jgi:hypothetical protein